MCVRGRRHSSSWAAHILVLANIGDHAIVSARVERAVEGRVDVLRHQRRRCGPGDDLMTSLISGLELPDVREPVGYVARWRPVKERQHGAQHTARVPDDRERGAHVLADLRRIDIDVDDVGVRGKLGGVAGDAIVEPAADIQQNVTGLDRPVHVDPAVHAGHSEIERVILRECPESVKCGNDRDPGLLGERPELVRGATLDHTVPSHDERPLGPTNTIDGGADRHRVGVVQWCISGQVHGPMPLRDSARLLRILRYVDQHRTGSAGRRQMERFPEDRRQIVGAPHEIIVLGDGNRDPRDVGLLKSVAAQHGARYLASDRDEWCRIHPRIRDRGHQVRRAGSAGRDAHAGPAGGARVPLGGVAGALLVATQHVVQPVAKVVHRVIERHDRAARHAEHHRDPFADEGFAHDLRTSARVRHGGVHEKS